MRVEDVDSEVDAGNFESEDVLHSGKKSQLLALNALDMYHHYTT